VEAQSETVTTECLDDILVVTINRPDVRNAVSAETATELARVFGEFDQDDSLKVAVFEGANGTFCAGADLKAVSEGTFREMPIPSAPMERNAANGPMGPSYMRLVKPVIGAISGYAVAGGLELALWCDMRVVESTAVFGVFCRRWGVPLIDGGTVRLPRLIGHSNALDLILTGRPVEADEAKVMGLANRVVEPGEARAAAIEIAKQMAKFPQQCMRNDRQSSYEQWDLSFEEAMINEAKLGRQVLDSGETVAGATRFASGKGRGGNFQDI